MGVRENVKACGRARQGDHPLAFQKQVTQHYCQSSGFWKTRGWSPCLALRRLRPFRFVPALLALLFLVALLWGMGSSSSALAAGYDDYERIIVTTESELRSAVSQASSKTMVVMGKDITLAGGPLMAPLASASCVLDLHGYTLSRDLDEAQSQGYVICIDKGCALSILDQDPLHGGTITGGNRIGSGGGIYNNGTLAMMGGNVTGNQCTGDGGGVFNAGSASFTDTWFEGNFAGASGGAICNEYYSTCIYNGGHIAQNVARSSGGAVCNRSYSAVEIVGAVIEKNQARWGGGIYDQGSVDDPNSCIISATSVKSNTASYTGGGIQAETRPTSGEDLKQPRLILENTTKIVGNVASFEGGGIYLDKKIRLLVTTVKVSENQSGVAGGGIYVVEGAILQMQGGPIVKENKVVSDGIKTASNVELLAANPIEIVGEMNSSASVGINLIDAPCAVVTKDYAEKGATEEGQLADAADCFFGAANQAVFLKNGEVKVADRLSYLDNRAVEKVVVDYELIDESFTGNETAGVWYVAYRDTAVAERPVFSADSHVLVLDGVTLTCERGMEVPKSGSLTIYAQSLGDAAGTIIANAQGVGKAAGIGSSGGTEMGALTINGGKVFAYGGNEGAGIGTGGLENANYYEAGWWESGPFVLNNGYVVAQGGSKGAGVGNSLTNYRWTTGSRGFNPTVSQMRTDVHGGTLLATGGNDGPGIGTSGGTCGGFSLRVDGGEVIALGGNNGSGIGGGSYEMCYQSDLYFVGGKVTATAGSGKGSIVGGSTDATYVSYFSYGIHAYFLGATVELVANTNKAPMTGHHEVYESEESIYWREVDNKVVAGTSAEAAVPVRTAERKAALDNAANNYALVTPCDHSVFDYVENSDGSYTATCALCDLPLGTGYVVTLDPGASSSGPKQVFVPKGKNLTLPTTDMFAAPQAQVIVGWVIGDTVYEPGSTLRVNGHMTAVAQWKMTWASVQDFIDNAAYGEALRLTNDIVATELDGPLTIPAGKSVEIDLAGYAVDRNLAEPTHKGCAIRVEGELSLRGSGTVTGANNSSAESFGGGGVSVAQGAKFTLRNAYITGNVATCGAGVYTQGDFNMLSGTIRDNATIAGAANGNGGGVMVDGGSFVQRGYIFDNTAAADGGGVMLRSGSYTLAGGIVRGNSAGGAGGGVYVGSDGVMTVSENCQVMNNVADGATNNVLLPDPTGNPLHAEGLDNGWVGVTALCAPTEGFTVIFSEGFADGDPTKDFFSDDAAYLVAKDPSGEAVLGVPVTISFDAGEVDAYWTMDPVTWVSGTVYTLPECGFRLTSSEQFVAWGMDDKSFSVGDAVLVVHDIAFTALWTETFPVWVGETQVTELNQADVLGDGTVSYDPATQTLTLNGFEGITGEDAYGAVIAARGSDLNVRGSGTITRSAGLTDTGIYVTDGSLTIGGDLDIRAWSYGIYVEGDVTLTEGTIKVAVKDSTGTGILCATRNSNTYIKSGITLVDVSSSRRAFYASYSNDAAVLDEGLYVMEPEDGSLTAKHVVIAPKEEAAAEPAFRTHALSLDGGIGVIFYMELPDIEGVDWSESYMEFSVAGKDGATTTDAFDAGDTNRSGTYYAFTCNVNSIQMADAITATFHYSADKTVSQTYSVAQYVEDFDAKLAADPEAFDETTVGLVHALADYGHYAQPYLADVRGWKLGDDHAEMSANAELTADMIADARTGLAAFAPVADLPDGGDVREVSMGLDLETNTTLCVFVTVNDEARVEYAELADGTELLTQELSDGRWVIELPGIMAHHLADVFDITITASGGTQAHVGVAAVSFAQVVLASGEFEGDADAQNLACALWRYCQAADAYMRAHPAE